jgi:hypothetical protein
MQSVGKHLQEQRQLRTMKNNVQAQTVRILPHRCAIKTFLFPWNTTLSDNVFQQPRRKEKKTCITHDDSAEVVVRNGMKPCSGKTNKCFGNGKDLIFTA